MKYLLMILSWISINFLSTEITMAAVRSDSTLNADRLGAKTEKINRDKYAKIFYVSVETGSDQNGDGSSNTPWKTVIHALAQISGTSDQTAVLLIGQGVYDHGTISMKSYIDMYGGFNPVNWERDIFRYATILCGQGIRRVVIGADMSRIDGFTIKNGLSRSHGAGVLCDDTSPIISNNLILHNLVLEPDQFNHNRIHQDGNIGGGVACLYNAVPVIRNNIFFGNRTSVGCGAAIAFYGWVRHKGGPEMTVVGNRLTGGLQGRVENNIIINNTSGINDIHRTRSSSGAGISCAYEARPVIQNNLIAMNQAMGRSDAGGIYCEYFSDPLINGNWVLGNISDDDGGGFYTMKLGQPLLENNFFAGNYTLGGGVGAIRLSKEGRARIVNNIIVFNPGGGVMSVDAYLELENSLIMNNPAGSGLKYVMNYSYFKKAVIRNNYIKDNEEGEVSVVKNVGPELQIEKRNDEPEFIMDETGETHKNNIISTKFDPARFTTTIKTNNKIKNPYKLKGRVIRIGDQWTLVNSAKDKNIVVWGNIAETRSSRFDIISDFRER